MEILIVIVLVILVLLLVLPIVAIVRTNRIRTLELRVAGLEAALLRLLAERTAQPPPPVPQPAPAIPQPPPPQPDPVPTPVLIPAPETEHLEQVIGRKWLGWIAIALIFGATVFFLKYAFENRWIGELGRVILGIAAGLALVWTGHNRHRAHWRYFSQILTGGGIAVLYLSIYGAFGYYHLIDQRSAFLFLAIVVAEAFLLASTYRSPSIAVMALIGGFLVPILLSTGRDQYAVLFTYITLLDLGMLGVVLGRSWKWVGSLAYIGTQLLFWSWYNEHYHVEKRPAALLFQAVIFAIFVLADLAPHLRRRAAGSEEWLRLLVNPFVFFATCYGLLNDDHHLWMAPLALLLALAYTALARLQLHLRVADRRMLFVTLGTALTFVTLAIPIQLESNWITLAWAIEAVALLWSGYETAAPPIRALSMAVFALAIGRFVFMDTPWDSRLPFTLVWNQYFLGVLALVACLAAAAWLCRRASETTAAIAAGLIAFAVLWLGSSIETYTWFSVQWNYPLAAPVFVQTLNHLRWASQLALSLLWSVYAGSLTAAGFKFRQRPLRIAGLTLFAITLGKVVLLDMAELQQFYRILALLVLGLVLLAAAWVYQRAFRPEKNR